MVRASEAQYLLEYEKIRSLVEREATISHRLAELAGHSRRACETDTGYAQSGAHARWESWAGQMAAVLNTELAQIRVQRQSLDAQMRKAFARHSALKELDKSNISRRKQERLGAKAVQLEQLAILCASNSRDVPGQ